jgi:hypothetical protein
MQNYTFVLLLYKNFKYFTLHSSCSSGFWKGVQYSYCLCSLHIIYLFVFSLFLQAFLRIFSLTLVSSLSIMCRFVGIHSVWCSLSFPDCDFMFIINLGTFSDIAILNISLFLPFYIPVHVCYNFCDFPTVLRYSDPFLKIFSYLWFSVWKVSIYLSLSSLVLSLGTFHVPMG